MKENRRNVENEFDALFRLFKRDSEACLATLGPSGTSSDSVAQLLVKKYRPEGRVLLSPSFEEAAEAVLSARAAGLFLPAAYANADTFFFDPRLSLLHCFTSPTPPYGLASRETESQASKPIPIRVATHPASRSMVAEFLGPDRDATIVEVRSTVDAADLTARGDTDLCVTNSHAAAAYGLSFLAPPRLIPMAWMVFGLSRTRSPTNELEG